MRNSGTVAINRQPCSALLPALHRSRAELDACSPLVHRSLLGSPPLTCFYRPFSSTIRSSMLHSGYLSRKIVSLRCCWFISGVAATSCYPGRWIRCMLNWATGTNDVGESHSSEQVSAKARMATTGWKDTQAQIFRR
ncbi:unnamed protein product [Victoria cruziana]